MLRVYSRVAFGFFCCAFGSDIVFDCFLIAFGYYYEILYSIDLDILRMKDESTLLLRLIIALLQLLSRLYRFAGFFLDTFFWVLVDAVVRLRFQRQLQHRSTWTTITLLT